VKEERLAVREQPSDKQYVYAVKVSAVGFSRQDGPAVKTSSCAPYGRLLGLEVLLLRTL